MEEQNQILKKSILIRNIILDSQLFIWFFGIAWTILVIYSLPQSESPYKNYIIISQIGFFAGMIFISLESYFWPKFILALINFILIILPWPIFTKKDLPSKETDLYIYIFGCIFFMSYILCYICSLNNLRKESSLKPKD